MDIAEFRRRAAAGETITAGTPYAQVMHEQAQEALKVTTRLNGSYHSPAEVRALFSELIGAPVDETFSLFPPFFADFGKNIRVGKQVFFNAGCSLQDQGGITIGDRCLIGHRVVMATLDHGMQPQDRPNLYPAPIVIGSDVWIGAGVVICPGVSVGDGSIVAAGAVVTKDVPARTVAAGVPARVVRELD